ncbi:hypothetical protein [Solicola gregarius]|uniref:Uncharacterized protein n=1 Tax=Solicola gregarius TaxID=2908642 RepID=A0AA46YNG3_9ACTN|nr:hypothetical protein [Solicola gregarius]UYM07589.1 hypothetical protein L0C25_11105 [Solicola gregarius]
MSQLSGPEEERLRRAMTMIGDEAATDTPRSQSPHSRWTRPGILVAACIAAVAVIATALYASDGSDPDQEASQALNGPETVACANRIFEGTIRTIDPTDRRSRVRMTVAVSRWYKPTDQSKRIATFVAFSTRAADVVRAYAPGQHVFIVEYDPPWTPVYADRAISISRSEVVPYLKQGAHTKCPDFWLHPDRHDVPDDS